MIDSRSSGDHARQTDPSLSIARSSSGDSIVDTSSFQTGESHVSTGSVLWTLTHYQSTAQARQWRTPTGYEFEMLIWTGPRVEGQEDLCWTQLLPSEEALVETARNKKRQLQAAGWLEQIDAAAI